MSSSTQRTIAITGVTGALGGEVVRLLAGADMRLDLRLLARDPARAPDVDTDVRRCDYRDPDPAALHGVDTLLFVSASESRDRRDVHRSFVAAAASAGVRGATWPVSASARPAAGTGRLRRSILPLGVSGIRSSAVNAAGTM